MPSGVVILYHPVQARYRIETDDSLALSMPDGTTQNQTIVRTSYITLQESGDSPIDIRVSLDSVLLTQPDSVLQALVDSAVGATWTGLMTPWGRLEHLTADRPSLFVDQLEPLLHALFPVLPETGARPAMAWSDSVQIPFRALARFEATEVRRTDFVADGYIAVAVGPALQITSHGVYSVTGSGTWFGQNMTVDGEGQVEGTHAIALDGRLVEASMSDSATLDLALPDVGQSVPAQIRGRARLTLLP